MWKDGFRSKVNRTVRQRDAGKSQTLRKVALVVRSNPVSMSVVLEKKPNYMALPLARWRCPFMCVCVWTEKVGLIRLTDSSHFSTTHSPSI